jgi:hypothetical protein
MKAKMAETRANYGVQTVLCPIVTMRLKQKSQQQLATVYRPL